jgi:DNA repair exonuclease SbcCD ATPase subunit
MNTEPLEKRIDELEKRVTQYGDALISQMKESIQQRELLYVLAEFVLKLKLNDEELADTIARLHPEIGASELFAKLFNRRSALEIDIEKIKQLHEALPKLPPDPQAVSSQTPPA